MPAWIKFTAIHSKDAFAEFGYLVVFALMPVWLTTILRLLDGVGMWSHLGSYLYSGEALLISAASVGPMIYMISREYDKRDDGFSRSFPGRRLLSILIFLVCLISAGIIGKQATFIGSLFVSKDILWLMSLFITLISVLLWLSITMIKNSLDVGAPGIMRLDTEDFVKKFGNENG